MEPSIRVVRGGPLVVAGGIPLARLAKLDRGPDRKPSWVRSRAIDVPEPYELCRCGHTSTPPRCDRAADTRCFDEPGGAAAAPLPVTWTIDGPDGPGLALKPNGPARMTGAIPLRHEDGEPFPLVDRCSFCRCGQSAAMPFCDGSHKAAGFHDDDPVGA